MSIQQGKSLCSRPPCPRSHVTFKAMALVPGAPGTQFPHLRDSKSQSPETLLVSEGLLGRLCAVPLWDTRRQAFPVEAAERCNFLQHNPLSSTQPGHRGPAWFMNRQLCPDWGGRPQKGPTVCTEASCSGSGPGIWGLGGDPDDFLGATAQEAGGEGCPQVPSPSPQPHSTAISQACFNRWHFLPVPMAPPCPPQPSPASRRPAAP